MKTLALFAASRLTIPATTAWYVDSLGEFRGKQELYSRQSPQKLRVLREHSIIESAVSSTSGWRLPMNRHGSRDTCAASAPPDGNPRNIDHSRHQDAQQRSRAVPSRVLSGLQELQQRPGDVFWLLDRRRMSRLRNRDETCSCYPVSDLSSPVWWCELIAVSNEYQRGAAYRA